MGLWGYSTEALANEVKRRAFRQPLSRNHSPGPGVQIDRTFVKIPPAGIAAASQGGKQPSVTECIKYDPTGTNGELLAQTNEDGTKYILIDVYHYGAAISGVADHEFEYLQVQRARGGWVVCVEYCDGDGSAATGPLWHDSGTWVSTDNTWFD